MQNILEQARQLYRLKRNQKLPKYKRALLHKVHASKSKIVGLYGSRGVGKTTLLLQLLAGLKYNENEKLYISCDHPLFYEISLFDFVEAFSRFGGEVIVIDEIHKIRDFQTQIKLMYDFLDTRVYFSGSSAVELTQADFTRRYAMFHLNILSLREFIEMKEGIALPDFDLKQILTEHETISHEVIDALPVKKILKYFKAFVDAGVYPYYFEDETSYLDRVNENINTILYTDLVSVTNIDSSKIITLKKLLLAICVSTPLEITLEKLAQKTGITKPTLYKYLHYLSRAELMHHITHEAKRYRNLKKPDKLYLNNTNLFSALCFQKNLGNIRETFFVSMVYNDHKIEYTDKGDFVIDEAYTIEIGGKNKGFEQIRDVPDSFVAADEIEVGFRNKIPLWLFGFLY